MECELGCCCRKLLSRSQRLFCFACVCWKNFNYWFQSERYSKKNEASFNSKSEQQELQVYTLKVLVLLDRRAIYQKLASYQYQRWYTHFWRLRRQSSLWSHTNSSGGKFSLFLKIEFGVKTLIWLMKWPKKCSCEVFAKSLRLVWSNSKGKVNKNKRFWRKWSILFD